MTALAGASRAASTRRDVRTPWVVAGVVVAATVVLAVRDPHDGGYGLCPLRALTGLACAGCGGLRATHDLATGDLAGAWAMNPLLVVAAPVAVVLWLVWVVRARAGRPPLNPPTWLWVALLGLVLAFSVLRNVPALASVLGPS